MDLILSILSMRRPMFTEAENVISLSIISGWCGIVIILACWFGNTYVASLQAETYMLASETNDKFKTHIRHPYTAMVGLSLGKKMEFFSSVILNCLVLSSTTIYLILSSELALIFFNDFFPYLKSPYELRLTLVIVAIVLAPVTWLGTPRESWWVALTALLATLISAILFTTDLWLNRPNNLTQVPVRTVTANTFFFGVGTMLFAFTGVPLFPNIHSAMKIKAHFTKAIHISYACIAVIYFIVALSGMILLGDSIKGNIIMNAIESYHYSRNNKQCTGKVLSYTALILLSIHFIFAYNLIFNTLAQEIEERLAVPKGNKVYLYFLFFTFRKAVAIYSYYCFISSLQKKKQL